MVSSFLGVCATSFDLVVPMKARLQCTVVEP